MSSSNKTSLGLNQWDATDPIQRVDFNKDNEIIDEVLGQKASLDGASFTRSITVNGASVWNGNNVPIESGAWSPIFPANCEFDLRQSYFNRFGPFVNLMLYGTLEVNSGSEDIFTITGLPYSSQSYQGLHFTYGTLLDGIMSNFGSMTEPHLMVVNDEIRITYGTVYVPINKLPKQSSLIFSGTYAIKGYKAEDSVKGADTQKSLRVEDRLNMLENNNLEMMSLLNIIKEKSVQL